MAKYMKQLSWDTGQQAILGHKTLPGSQLQEELKNTTALPH